jgi:hypothetical protein
MCKSLFVSVSLTSMWERHSSPEHRGRNAAPTTLRDRGTIHASQTGFQSQKKAKKDIEACQGLPRGSQQAIPDGSRRRGQGITVCLQGSTGAQTRFQEIVDRPNQCGSTPQQLVIQSFDTRIEARACRDRSEDTGRAGHLRSECL